MRVSIHVAGRTITRDVGPALKPAVAHNPVYDPELAAELGDEFWFETEASDWDGLPTRHLDIASIASIQRNVYPPRLKSLESAEILPPILVRKIDGQNVVFDGNHRLVHAIKNGRRTIAAKVRDGAASQYLGPLAKEYGQLAEQLIEFLAKKARETHDEAPGHQFHGNQYVKVAGQGHPDEPSEPKPVKAKAAVKKHAVHELLSSGHKWSLQELADATGHENLTTLASWISMFKNEKTAGKLGALTIKKHDDGTYQVMKGDKPAPAAPVPPPPVEVVAGHPAPEKIEFAGGKEVPVKEAEQFGLWAKPGEAMKPSTDGPITTAKADEHYKSKIDATLGVLKIAAKGEKSEEQLDKLALIWKESKAQAMAQWKAHVDGKEVMPKAQAVFKADKQLIKDLAAGMNDAQALAAWKSNTAGEKSGTWPPDPAVAAKKAAEEAKAKAEQEELLKTTVHTEPHFSTVADYAKSSSHISVNDFHPQQATVRSKFDKGLDQIRSALKNGHPDAVANKIGVQKQLENRLAASKAFNALVAQRKIAGNTSSLAASLISSWASSSGDHQPVSVANQLAIRDAFDMPHDSVATDALHLITKSKAGEEDVYSQAAATLKCKYDTPEQKATFKAGLRDFALAQYHETQEHFKQLGVSEVYLARGMKLPGPEKADHGKLKLQPASSFSTQLSTATSFAGGGSVFLVKVPASQILSSFVTGFGCTSENEVVILAHPNTEAVRVKASHSGPGLSEHVAKSLTVEPSPAEIALQQYEKAKASAAAAKAAAAAETKKPEVKNAYYYQKLSKAVKAHKAYTPENYEQMKKAGWSHEKILAHYNKVVA